MKNRLIITVSDIKGTKSYNVHQIVKKVLFSVVLIVLLILGFSFWFMSSLNDEITNVKKNKEIEFKILNEKEEKLLAQNKLYSMQIKSKVKDIDELNQKLDQIHTIIGVGKNATKAEITAKTLSAINLDKRKYTLRVIPNGNPLNVMKVSSNFGYRINPITKRKQFHRGLDLAAPRKTPIKATADGIVEYVQSKNTGDYGRVVKISHNYGFKTTFAHMHKTNVKVGQIVKKGEVIGLVGSSGRSSGPHLHYEIRYASTLLSPKNFINWKLNSYESIFKKERKVEWESLINLIKNQHKVALQ